MFQVLNQIYPSDAAEFSPKPLKNQENLKNTNNYNYILIHEFPMKTPQKNSLNHHRSHKTPLKNPNNLHHTHKNTLENHQKISKNIYKNPWKTN